MKQRLTNEAKEHAEVQAEQTAQQRSEPGRQFASAEELLRFDAAQTAVPPQLRERVLRQVEAEKSTRQPWWKRWFR